MIASVDDAALVATGGEPLPRGGKSRRPAPNLTLPGDTLDVTGGMRAWTVVGTAAFVCANGFAVATSPMAGVAGILAGIL